MPVGVRPYAEQVFAKQPASSATEESHRFAPTSGTITGWLGVLVALALVVEVAVNDPSLRGARWIVGLLLAAVLVWAFMLRPRLLLRGRTLVLRNPLEDIEVPLGLVTRFQVRQATFVHVEDKRFVGVAVGRPLRQMVRPTSDNSLGSPLGFGRSMRIGAPQPQARDLTIELLEERVRSGRSDAVRLGETDGAVRRTPVRWLLGVVAGLVVVLVVLLLL